MWFFRMKLFAAVLFCLISLGQAYPYAVVYGHSRETQCGCNLQGRSCIHGCDLKKKSSAPPCHPGMQHQDSQLSFQTEPFLLSPVQALQGPAAVDFFLNPPLALTGFLLSCDDPPPKDDDLPEDPA
jgi:hypothetical protein